MLSILYRTVSCLIVIRHIGGRLPLNNKYVVNVLFIVFLFFVEFIVSINKQLSPLTKENFVIKTTV